MPFYCKGLEPAVWCSLGLATALPAQTYQPVNSDAEIRCTIYRIAQCSGWRRAVLYDSMSVTAQGDKSSDARHMQRKAVHECNVTCQLFPTLAHVTPLSSESPVTWVTGKVPLTRKAIAQLIGKVFIQKSAVNLLSTVLDTPEFFWSAPDSMQVRCWTCGCVGSMTPQRNAQSRGQYPVPRMRMTVT